MIATIPIRLSRSLSMLPMLLLPMLLLLLDRRMVPALFNGIMHVLLTQCKHLLHHGGHHELLLLLLLLVTVSPFVLVVDSSLLMMMVMHRHDIYDNRLMSVSDIRSTVFNGGGGGNGV